MSFLQDLVDGQRRQEYEDFANRYDQGSPYDGIDDREAYDRYSQVSGLLSPQDYEAASQQSFERMSPQERMQFGRYLQQQARQRGYQDRAWDHDDDMYRDPRYLSHVTGRMHRQQPGMLGQLLGDGTGALGNPLAKAALAGVAATGARKIMSR